MKIFEIILSVIIGYLILNIIFAFSISPTEVATGKCNKEVNRRIEYVFWGYTFGCWLFEDIKGVEK